MQRLSETSVEVMKVCTSPKSCDGVIWAFMYAIGDSGGAVKGIVCTQLVDRPPITETSDTSQVVASSFNAAAGWLIA